MHAALLRVRRGRWRAVTTAQTAHWLNERGPPRGNAFAESDAWAKTQQQRATKARGFTGWLAIAEMPIPSAAPDRAKLPWRRLALRFRVHVDDARVWLIHPCSFAKDKWRSLQKREVQNLAHSLLIILGWKATPKPLEIGFAKEWPHLAQARRLVEALLVERDAWLAAGAKPRKTMRALRWEDFA
ncbi:MAG: hypothetical protein QM817_10415 [Archangium sp.]